MGSYVLRVWLADRPGALGEIATGIGAAGGDLTGIDILERGEGRAIDELTFELPDEDLVPLLLEKVGELEGVDVEDVRPAAGSAPPLDDPLEIAAGLLERRSVDQLFPALLAGVTAAFGADWAALVDPDGPAVLDASRASPPVPWLEAFVTGTRSASSAPEGAAVANDVAWATLELSGLALLLGRSGRPLRARERRQLATLCRIGDHCRHELLAREGRRAHPARSS